MEAALTAVTELTTTEARLCQFWVRGRCNRENCEFRHEVETKSTAMDAPATPAAPIVAVKSTPAPSAPGDDTLALAEESVRDSSTFIAATDATAELGDKPLLVRRARNTVKKLNGNSDNNGGGLEVEAAEPEAEEAAAAQARADAAAAEIKQATQEAAVAEDSVIEVSVSEEPTREASVTESSVGNDGTATATEESAASPSKDGDGAAEESIESIVNFIQEGNTSVPQKEKPRDDELPKFDPQKFKPGYTPPVVKKGDQEYNIIVSGVKDTGLCGKYWSDMEALPSRRRRTTVAEAQKAAAEEAAKAAAAASGSSAEKKRGGRKQSLKEKLEVNDANPSTTNPTATATGAEEEEEAEDDPPEPPTATPGVVKSGAGRKRKQEVNNGETEEPESKKAATLQTQQTETDQAASQQLQPEGQVTKTESRVPDNSSADNVQPADRNVSCIAGGSTEGASQREVVVECFAPYDDHRWVNIGKQRDGMAPDAVQYARALRPPYHLLSFLRVKGHSTKGMSCTDKNTMVFVVLEGEITVVLHTTQFNAKKGDSFYIPPKNYYDLINNKAREAELSLIQFQYDGPLPTVNAASQSGQSTAAAASAAASTSSQAAPPK